MLFRIAIVIFLIFLILDVVIALGFYVVLKPVNKNLALLSSFFRVLFNAILGIGLLALALLFIDAYIYSELIAYIFSIFHLFILGYLVFKSGYIPRILGVLVIIASFCYILTMYGDFLLPKEWYEALYLPASFVASGELLFEVWLLLKGSEIQTKCQKLYFTEDLA